MEAVLAAAEVKMLAVRSLSKTLRSHHGLALKSPTVEVPRGNKQQRKTLMMTQG